MHHDQYQDLNRDLCPDQGQGQGLHQGQDHQIAPGHHSRRLHHQIQIEVEIVKGRKEEINKNIIKYQQRLLTLLLAFYTQKTCLVPNLCSFYGSAILC